MRLDDLAGLGRSPNVPLDVQLASGALQVSQWLRVLPGHRYVGEALWGKRKVLAKLLVGIKADRHYASELKGARWLAEQGLQTPALLEHGWQEGQGGWLLFEFLDAPQSLGDAWCAIEWQSPLTDSQQQLLGSALQSIAGLHARGLWQADLHLDNLLRSGGDLWIIDGGAVKAETPGQPLSRQKVLENLGMFFAQLPAGFEEYLEELLLHYLLGNAEHALPLELLRKEIARVRSWRLRDYMKKIHRDCSLFSARVGAFGLRVVRRDCAALLNAGLALPDALISQGESLKNGGSATVVRVPVGGRMLLVKRYNMKNLSHRLKRFWRPSRAWHSWREGNRLELLGINTPQPLAIVENRWCWLRGRAWLVTEYCSGEDILSAFKPWLDSSPPATQLLALQRLFAALISARISHGDFKGTNVLWDEARCSWSLIDLDAMRQHSSQRRFVRSFACDRARFLRNWPEDSALYKVLDQCLPQVPGACPD